MPEFQKILIANRGEIAIRVMRAANELGKRTVAVYAEEDKLSLHRFKADEAYKIGEGLGPVAAYLSIEEIIRVAKMCGADAIHPGYGLLSENPDFVDACTKAGITFIGPKAETMRALGDKASARRVAIEAGVPVIPATEVLGDDMEAIRAEAAEIGYPLMLKASWGGGGRGMRPIMGPDELEEKVREGRREAEAAFGNGEGYLEKMILRARHVEVQILGDSHGAIYHLYERDCSVQRRNQKVVERAPAPYLSETQREEICLLGKRICEHVNYECAGTVEFLMDMESGAFYFIEVNPRVQVEHTVTEEVTGIDIVRAQILIAEGKSLVEATGTASQYDVKLDGHAIQCRVTTEDPTNNFIPDYGRITAYRGATGMGIRLDGGTAYSGAVITRYYDSLLEKVTAWAPTPEAAIARMDRALREFRIRGVSTNIAFVENLLKHPTFLNYQYHTKFIDETPELFDFAPRRDRATKILRYIADITVNGHPETAGRPLPVSDIKLPRAPAQKADILPGTRDLLDKKGPQAVADWMAAQKHLLITDTTMRDGHQSLLATRMRSIDMINVAPAYAANLPGLFSVECWGGATFDVAYRFLQECPWQRLRDIRRAMPNVMTQMLLRASNGVGYTNYPDNVVQSFVAQAATSGVDVFRVFDSLNWVENMRVAMDAVIEANKVCEGTICYTGDILDPARAKYDLKYYVEMGKSLRDAGAHVLGLKDMAGLLKPASATLLIKALKEEVGLPIHFHTHDTAGIACATILAASEAGVDAVDCAMDALSGNTSQATLGTVVEALKHTPRDTRLDIKSVREISDYWEAVRGHYAAFESGMQAPASEVYLHEMPGGQFTNLKAQARSLGLEERWHEVAQMYADVNQMFGDIVKVTPSSKVVGDMALMMVSQGLTRDQVEDPTTDVAFPDSVIDMMRGNLGQPPGGFPPGILKKVLKDEAPVLDRPGKHLKPVDLEKARSDLSAELGLEIDDEDLNGYLMYPKVFTDYMTRHAEYGPVRTLPTRTFFYGMDSGEEIEAEIDPGVTLVIRMQAVGETNDEGEAKVFFELNGQPRTIRVPNRKIAASTAKRPKAELGNPNHIGAPMPGVVASVAVQPGAKVKEGDLLLTIEAMKMETGIHADRDATVKAVHVTPGGQIDAKDLLVELG
ncbi:pyruvate carboxylase [Roseobacter sp. HKCCD9010]|uniref:pyruvate carboxylase n=1 Tax=unclassified Roseobacter TaxID=196798 RepID=UPI001491A0D0|nr:MULTISPECIES: pyruvate carboxylase [unclassified Roseobacter]MBF9049504.1 pyruvate carboxylase [Rhodobacterales bacterium HKCCD4356]NNV11504.1 pyruvate carboxylase [Roseobacter sp. HKCCD7357]NNV15688.1 pyruvate carboxylase [Roseobacter sp. HKCCD8768]NNV25148.1 pyruvate carboxylase [Roseobacter sp. HKCCD8192]NNV29405.1 pyruvate carboxylase [Roseobacter sp. HKCCD9061]